MVNDKVFGSFADNFDFILRTFRAGGKECKPIVFVLEEFDLFTKHKSQLLLYTILNTIQTSTSPMCLVGETCRLDVLDLLEKRVKSRFSHRQIYLFNEYSCDEYLDLAKDMFIELYGKANGGFGGKNEAKNVANYAEIVFGNERIKQLLRRQFDLDKSMPTLKRLLLIPSVEIDCEVVKSKDAQIFENEFVRSYKSLNADTRNAYLNGISILELTLIVIMKIINEQYVDEPINFDMVFNEYVKFCNKKTNGQKYEKQVVLKVRKFLFKKLNFCYFQINFFVFFKGV